MAWKRRLSRIQKVQSEIILMWREMEIYWSMMRLILQKTWPIVKSTESDLEETTIRNPDNGSLKEQEEQDLSENLKDFAEELRSQIRNFDIALEGSAENGLEETTDRNPENTTEREDKTELLTPGVHKARVPIARLRDALDDEELGDKSGFRCAVC